MIINDFSQDNSLLNHFIAELRDVTVQNDRMRFRRNLERIGEILGYELSKTLSYFPRTLNTPLGTKDVKLIKDQVVLCTILRAGLPLYQGMLNYFDHAENTFVSAYRHHFDDKDDFEIRVEYLATPNLEDKTLIITDPMLATGSSMVAIYNHLLEKGTPKEVHIVAVIGSKQGIEFVSEHFPENTKLWIAAVDDDLNSRGYIIPGLGDAGDLAFGEKL